MMKGRVGKHLAILLAIAFIFSACATLNVGDVPFEKWSPKQKGTFFMKIWESQKITYDMLNDMKDKPADLIEVLIVKQQILEQSRIPVRTYATMVKSGGVPDANSEDEIMAWLRQLQLQLVYGKGG
jgi:hypothetical protein